MMRCSARLTIFVPTWPARGSCTRAAYCSRLGAFRAAGPLRTMAIFATREAAEEYAAGDPFVLNGMVTGRSIDEGTDAVRG